MAEIRTEIVDGPDGDRHLTYRLCPPATATPRAFRVAQARKRMTEQQIIMGVLDQAVLEQFEQRKAEMRRKRMDETFAMFAGIIIVVAMACALFAYITNRTTQDDPMRARVKLEKVKACNRLEDPSDRTLCLVSIK